MALRRGAPLTSARAAEVRRHVVTGVLALVAMCVAGVAATPMLPLPVRVVGGVDAVFCGTCAFLLVRRLAAPRTVELAAFAVATMTVFVFYGLELAALDPPTAADVGQLTMRALYVSPLVVLGAFTLLGPRQGIAWTGVMVSVLLAVPLLVTPVGPGELLGVEDVPYAVFVCTAVAVLGWGLTRSNVVLDAEREASTQVAELAYRDDLTGLANRRELERRLDRLVDGPHVLDRPTAVVLLDLDHFKLVNDVHGHDVGDDVLRHVGAALRGVVRDGDVAGRWGGEEFCVLLDEVRPDDVGVLVERIRLAVRACDAPVPVSASLGVALLQPDDSARSVLRRADTGLYEAKEAGRDRAVVSA